MILVTADIPNPASIESVSRFNSSIKRFFSMPAYVSFAYQAIYERLLVIHENLCGYLSSVGTLRVTLLFNLLGYSHDGGRRAVRCKVVTRVNKPVLSFSLCPSL